MKKFVTTLGLLIGLCVGSTAQAAEYTGSATDPNFDLLQINDSPLPDPRADFTSVSVKYYDVAGRVEVIYGFDQSPSIELWLDSGIGLGTMQNGECTAPTFITGGWNLFTTDEAQHQALIRSESQVGSALTSGVTWDSDTYAIGWSEPTGTWTNDNLTWRYTTTNARLVGRGYTCASAGMTASKWEVPVGAGWGEDRLESGIIQLKRTEDPEPEPPPAVPQTPTPPVIKPLPPEVVKPLPPPLEPEALPAPKPKFTKQMARLTTRRILARRYGVIFRDRQKLQLRCWKTSPLKWSCFVRFRTKDTIYEGKLRLRVQGSGRTAVLIRPKNTACVGIPGTPCSTKNLLKERRIRRKK